MAWNTNKLIIKAMIDLLRDINMKSDAFKSTPEDLASLKVMCKNCESLSNKKKPSLEI